MTDGSLDEYLAAIREFPPLAPDAERDLATRVRAGDQEALDLLVRSNLRYVPTIAEELRDRGVTRSDLINEGNLGLLRAAFKYDERVSVGFGVFAETWVRAAMQQAIVETARIPRTPAADFAEGGGRDSTPAT